MELDCTVNTGVAVIGGETTEYMKHADMAAIHTYTNIQYRCDTI